MCLHETPRLGIEQKRGWLSGLAGIMASVEPNRAVSTAWVLPGSPLIGKLPSTFLHFLSHQQ